jgi:peptidoglycan/xylan/chitin deacetylase (PgdA/CDA1 family)
MAGPIGHPGVIGHPATSTETQSNTQAQDAVPIVTLTFDDGPDKALTPLLLQILAKHNIKAAFFVLGERLQAGGLDIMRSAHKQGHQIGNHSFNHPNLANLPVGQVREQIEKTQTLIGDCTSAKKYFRPPYGSLNGPVRDVAKKGGYTTVLWNDDSLDWKIRNASWIDGALSQIRHSGRTVVLNHDIHKSTVDNIESFIVSIRAKFPRVSFLPLE